MALPKGIGVVDTLLGIPSPGRKEAYSSFRPLLRDHESLEVFDFPAQYQYRNRPDLPKSGTVDEMIEYTLTEMDTHGVWRALVDVTGEESAGRRALELHPDRFDGTYGVDPNEGVAGIRKLERAVDELGVKAASATPAFVYPQVPINDKKLYPVYSKCVELDIPIVVTTGVPGPRVPMYSQDVALIDEVCWFFPDLRFVMRHGGEPWTDLAVKLLLKWPNLYYSTSAFAPKHYPQDIIDFANTRGADKVIYAGYFPTGLSLERIFADLPSVPFRERVWPKFLRENAVRVFKLEE